MTRSTCARPAPYSTSRSPPRTTSSSSCAAMPGRRRATRPVRRLGLAWPGHAEQRLTGLGARHGLHVDQAGRSVVLGADRRYTGPTARPTCSTRAASRRATTRRCRGRSRRAAGRRGSRPSATGAQFALGDEIEISARAAAGPLRLHLFCASTPAARLRAFLRAAGSLPALLPEWAYGHWKSRDVYEHQRDVEADFEGYAEHNVPLDAIVIDSPWETQYNTWEFNPHQFPDAPGLIARMRADGVRTVVWVTPWVNLDADGGQVPPDPGSARLHREPAAELRGGRARRSLRARAGRRAVGRRSGGWATARPSTSRRPRPRRGGASRPSACSRSASQGIKADDGEGFYYPDEVAFADGRSGAEAGWAQGLLYRRSMQRALDEVHPGEGVLFGRPGWTGQQAVGVTWGGDQPSDFWSLRTLVAATLHRGRVGLLELVARRRRLPRREAHVALPEGAAAAVGAVRLLHAADARARALRAGGVDLRRRDARPSTASSCCCTSGSCPTCARRPPPRRAAGCRSSARCC